MGYKLNPATKVASGVVHNPRPSTERGKRRHAKRTPEKQAEVAKKWGN